MTEISAKWKSLLLVEYSKNTFACELMEGIIHDDRYRVVDDIIYYKDRIKKEGKKMKSVKGNKAYFIDFRCKKSS
jgi:hypothetical protein